MPPKNVSKGGSVAIKKQNPELRQSAGDWTSTADDPTPSMKALSHNLNSINEVKLSSNNLKAAVGAISSVSKPQEVSDDFFDHALERGKKRSLTDDKKFSNSSQIPMKSDNPTNTSTDQNSTSMMDKLNRLDYGINSEGSHSITMPMN